MHILNHNSKLSTWQVNEPRFTFLYVPNDFRGYNPNLSWYNDHFITITNYKREFLKNLLFLQHIAMWILNCFASHLNQNGQLIMPIDIYSSKLLVCFCMWFHHHTHICIPETTKKWIILDVNIYYPLWF